MSEERIIRQRTADLEAYNDRVAVSSNDCDVSTLAQTSTLTTYPTVASAVYYLVTGQLDADDAEGASGTFVADGGALYALNLGATVPPTGTNVIVTSVGGRNCFRFG